ncbi:hypothetical protein D3C83_226310 [compost metagenome]
MIWKRRIKHARLSGIGSNRFNANTEHIAILREEQRRVLVKARAVRSVFAGINERRPIRA